MAGHTRRARAFALGEREQYLDSASRTREISGVPHAIYRAQRRIAYGGLHAVDYIRWIAYDYVLAGQRHLTASRLINYGHIQWSTPRTPWIRRIAWTTSVPTGAAQSRVSNSSHSARAWSKSGVIRRNKAGSLGHLSREMQAPLLAASRILLSVY